MQSVLMVRANIFNAEKWQSYAELAKPVLQEYGASVLMMDLAPSLLTQGQTPDMVALISFPTKRQIEACYHSEQYQKLLPLRDEAADVTFIAAGPLNNAITSAQESSLC